MDANAKMNCSARKAAKSPDATNGCASAETDHADASARRVVLRPRRSLA